MSPIRWVQRNFPQASLEVVQNPGDSEKVITDHEIIALIDRPNKFYDSTALWAGTLYSWIFDGNAYWIKVRTPRPDVPWNENVAGEVVELWYAPHWMMTPIWPLDGSQFIRAWRYAGYGGPALEVVPENVLHFRNGIDPRNTRLGMSGVWSEFREIFGDDEAANFMASILRNMGVPGVVISPDGSGGAFAGIEKGDADVIRAWFSEKAVGDNRGAPLVLPLPTKVSTFGLTPAQLNLANWRDTAEERVCAALGLPPAIVGFGAGLGTAKVGATMIELKKMAWENCLLPIQRAMAVAIGHDLLPEFEARPLLFRVRWNYEKVSAMQENLGDKAKYLDIMVQGGWCTVANAQRQMGNEVDETQDVYLRSSLVTAVPANEEIDFTDNTPALPPAAPTQMDPGGEDTGNPTPTPPKQWLKFLEDVKAKSPRKAAHLARYLMTMHRQEGKLARKARVLFKQQGKQIATAYAAVGPKYAAATRKTMTGKKDWLDDALRGQDPKWAATLQAANLSSAEAGWALLASEIPAAIAFDVFRPEAVRWASTTAAQKIKNISATTEERVRATIADAITNGSSIPKTQQAIQELFDEFGPIRAETIARTETAAAVNYGKMSGALETQAASGVTLEKEWACILDDRTRDSHLEANGQKQTMAEPFDVGGSLLQYPGDPDGPAEEVINCRCTQFFNEVQEAE
jgi:phage portal protein BeeE